MKTLLTLLFILTTAFCFGQKNGSVTGVLADSVNHTNMVEYATVSIYKSGDSVLTNYRLSDEKGLFKISNLETGIKYRVVVTAWQYKIYRKDITITAENPVLDLGTLFLSAKDNSVDEVVITAERPPVIVRKDTIEFNAESFKTLPTAVVEDLLKKLPGVTVGADGTIQVNGKAVSKILVDGKEFFGGDQQIATKNLPANIIDKVQVSDDDEAKRRDPDLTASNTPQVINLKLKKAIKQGAFGKLYAGKGLESFYEAGGIMSFFRDTTQLSVLAYGNNINKPGFTIGDISKIGGFDRSGYNSVMISSDGGFALDNISFGGLGGGVQKSYGGGFNLNTLTKGGVKINGKYFYGQNNSVTEQLLNDNQTLGANRLITNTNSTSFGNNGSHNVSAKIEWKIDSLTTLTINPGLGISPKRYSSSQDKVSTDAADQLLNNSRTTTQKNTDNYQYNMTVNLWKDFKKKGRSFNTSLNLTKSDNLDENFNSSASYFANTGTNSNVDQLRNTNIRNFNTYLSANYSEPISKKFTLSLGLNGNYINNENALATFFKDPSNQAYDVVVPTLTETVNQSGIKSNSRASIKWAATKDLSIQPAIVMSTINLKNGFTNHTNFEQHYSFLFPSLIIRYKALSFSYSPSFTEPDVQYIQPVANNTDPLFIQNGNANLLPAKTHQINLNLYKYDVKHSLNYNIYANGSLKNNGVIMSRSIQADGVQVSTPVNADGIKQFNAGASITKDLKNAKTQISLTTGFWTNYNENIVEVNSIRSKAYNLSLTPRAAFRINLNDKFEFNESYNLTINNSSYDDNFFTDRKLLTHSSETEMIIRYPKNLVFETTFRMQINSQKIAGYDNNLKVWNAGLTYLFMKNNRAQLKFSVNDILQSNVRRYVYITDNSIRDSQTNNIGRYALLTLTYNIQNFGGKVGGKERFFGF